MAGRPSQFRSPLLEVSGLTVGYGGLDKAGMPLVPVVREVDLAIREGEALGVIGESGCGKSTLARGDLRSHCPSRRNGVACRQGVGTGLAQRSREELREIQLVFQMADTALNPRVTIAEIIGRPLTFFFGMKGAKRATGACGNSLI